MSGVTCPYLGIADDAETALAYPSQWNCCFRKGASTSVSLEHQRNYCLATAYAGCPIYLQSGDEVGLEEPNSNSKKQTMVANNQTKQRKLQPHTSLKISRKNIIIAVGLLLGLFFLIWGVVWGKQLLDSNSIPLFANPGITPTRIPTLINEIIIASSTLELLTPTSRVVVVLDPPPAESLTTTVLVSTKTPEFSPSSTEKTKNTKEATETPKPVITDSCGAPAGWILYTVKQGDTLSSLSRVLGVTIAQLQSANCMGSSTQLYLGTSIYVPFTPPVIKTATPIPSKTSIPNTKTPVPPTNTPAFTKTSIPATATLAPTETLIPPTATEEIIEIIETTEADL